MKKILTLLSLVLSLGLANAQTNTVTGTITDCLGAPVVGHAVYIMTDSLTGTAYYNTVYTNASGVYTDNSIPYNTFLGGVQPIYIYTIDPTPGTGWYTATENPTTSGNVYTHDFSVACGGGGGGPSTCAVSFYSYEDSTGTNDTTYLVLSISSSSPASTTVAWDFGDGSFATGPIVNHVYATNGYYNVCVTIFDASDSCTATYCDTVADIFRAGFVLSSVYAGAPLGIKEEKQINVNIFPNPAQDELYITSPDLSKASSIIIYDMTGRPVSITNNTALNNTRLNISSIENGSYILVLVDATNLPLYTHTLIKR
jgi:hypothetical protein